MLLTIIFLVPATVLAYFVWRVSTETTRSHSPICLPALFALAGALHGQQMISAKAGLLNHLEGNALLNGYQIMLKPGEFPQMKEGDTFRTDAGHQEVLLGPGVFLRLGEDSRFRLVSALLTDTRVDFQAGSAVIECASQPEHAHLAFTFKKATVSILKDGVYRLDSDPGQLEVYAGEARVLQGEQTQTVGKDRRLVLDGVSVPGKFDDQTGDALYQWAKRRSEYLAAANVSAAVYVHQSGVSYASSSWVWNPSYKVYTFLPPNGSRRNFWGFEYHSPAGPAVRASGVDSLSAAQQRRDALAAASTQTDTCGLYGYHY
jgi:hypothetical protein